MAHLIITGGKRLSGKIRPAGNKNALLPMMCAALLADGETCLENVPPLSDLDKIANFYRQIGIEVIYNHDSHELRINSSSMNRKSGGGVTLPTGIRSTVLLIAPLVIACRNLSFDTESKGCALGIREIDPHLRIAEKFGCKISGSGAYDIKLDNTLKGTTLWADYQSVTSTETFLMFAVAAKGRSQLINAASEPHVQAFCEFLCAMGAKIEGIGSSVLTIEGTDGGLNPVKFRVPDDHHEIATWAAIGAATSGDVHITSPIVSQMGLIIQQFCKLGLNIVTRENNGVPQLCTGESSHVIQQGFTAELTQKIEAAPWPYFPADLLPQAIGAAIACKGEVLFWNKVYEGALFWTPELSKFGAKLHLSDPHRLMVMGSPRLHSADVEAPYIIRVVLGLVIAALQIPGTSTIRNADPVTRAHPDFLEKIRALGADIEWVD